VGQNKGTNAIGDVYGARKFWIKITVEELGVLNSIGKFWCGKIQRSFEDPGENKAASEERL